MIQRYDLLAVDLPVPESANPAAAAAVQELMGGKFGEMSTLMNYTFQSFNFRGKEKYRPFYDLICNIATEEYSHIEAVAAAINLLLTGATMRADRNKPDGKTAKSTAKKVKNLAYRGHRSRAPRKYVGVELSISLSCLRTGSNAIRFNGQCLEWQLRYRNGQSQDGPATQLLSRMRRSRGQDARLRDDRRSHRACDDRIPSRPRRRSHRRLCQGFGKAHRRGCRSAAAHP